jgi:hypothetical protein
MQLALCLASEQPLFLLRSRLSPQEMVLKAKYGKARTGARGIASFSNTNASSALSFHFNPFFFQSSVSGLQIAPYPLMNFR